MASPSIGWASLNGQRTTSAGATANHIVAGYHTQGIDDVTFVLKQGVTTLDTIVVTTEQEWLPTDTEFADELTGSTHPETVLGYGITLDLATLPAGRIDIEVTVHVTAGTDRTLPTHCHYNDKTGDSRPCTDVVYVSDVTGNDTNDGLTTSTPVLTTLHAAEILAGLGAGGYCGGGRIQVLDQHTVRNPNGGLWPFVIETSGTSDCFPLVIEPAPGVAREDCVILRHDQATQQACELEPTTRADVRFSNVYMRGISPNFAAHDGPVGFQFEHCVFCPLDPALGPGLPDPHVDAYVSTQSLSIPPAKVDRAAWVGCRWDNCSTVGMAGGDVTEQLIRGCSWRNCSGIEDYIAGANVTTAVVVNCENEGPRGNGNLLGCTGCTGTFDLIESPAFAGNIRVRAKGTITYASSQIAANGTFADVAQYLIGSAVWGYKVAGFAGYATNTAAVLGSGNDGTYDYVDVGISYTGAVGNTADVAVDTAAVADIDVPVGLTKGQRYIDVVHANKGYNDLTLAQNVYRHRYRSWGTIDTRGLIIQGSSGVDAVSIVWRDCVSLVGSTEWHQLASSLIGCAIVHCEIGLFQVRAAVTFTNCEIRDSVIGDIAYLDGDAATLETKLGAGLHHNHFLDAGDEIGSTNTTGATVWTAGNEAATDAAGDFTKSGSFNGLGVASDSTDIGVNDGSMLTGAWEAASGSPYTLAFDTMAIGVAFDDVALQAAYKLPIGSMAIPVTFQQIQLHYSGDLFTRQSRMPGSVQRGSSRSQRGSFFKRRRGVSPW